MTGKLEKFEKYLAFSLEFAIKLFPVSLGLLILRDLGDIFFIFFDKRKLISLNFPLLWVPINIFFITT